MFIHNITVNIDESVHEQWLDWAQNYHIKKMIETGCFTSAKLVKVLVDEEMGGVTYSLQFVAETKEALENYKKQHERHFNQEGLKLFADKMLSFKTDLAIISEHE